jgi:hypothetical protein
MEQSSEATTLDKAAVDASLPGPVTISTDSSAHVELSTFADAFSCLFQRVQGEHGLVLHPLRLVLVTADLGNVTRRWQRAVGQPESGASEQPEG